MKNFLFDDHQNLFINKLPKYFVESEWKLIMKILKHHMYDDFILLTIKIIRTDLSIFRKGEGVTYPNITCHKKSGFHPFSENTF